MARSVSRPGRWRSIFLVCGALYGLLIQSAEPQNSQPVALELVLAIDTSTSVDAREFLLQRDGLASAFRHPSVQKAIDALGPEGLAVSVLQWSGRDQYRTSIGWRLVRNREQALQLAAELAGMPRSLSGFTDIATAIAASQASIENNGYSGRRLTIDVSGDGVSDRNDPSPARDKAVSAGITVNGLIVHSDEYDLGQLARIDLRNHYRNSVIGGPGAFLMEAESFDDFADAIRRKLVREIAGLEVVRASSVPNVGLSRSSGLSERRRSR